MRNRPALNEVGYLQSKSIHRSTHSKGGGQATAAQGAFDGQLRRTPCDVVAWPHCVPFSAGGSGSGLDSSRMSSKQPAKEATKNTKDLLVRSSVAIIRSGTCVSKYLGS